MSTTEIPEEQAPREPVSRCKICLHDYDTIDGYNQHIDKFDGETERYADHGKVPLHDTGTYEGPKEQTPHDFTFQGED